MLLFHCHNSPISRLRVGLIQALGPSHSSEVFSHMHKATPLIAVALSALLLCSCASSGGNRLGGWVADEAEIRSLVQSSMESWNRGDLPSHLAYYDQNVTYITNNGPRPGVAAIEESFKKNYFQNSHPIQSLRYEQIAVRPLARDVALATGRYVLSGGAEPDHSGWFTLVWVRSSEGWRVVHDHSD